MNQSKLQSFTQGPAPRYCRVCEFGFHQIVDEGLNKGETFRDVLRRCKEESAYRYKASRIRREHLKFHSLSKHSKVKLSRVSLIKSTRRNMKNGRKSMDAIFEGVMNYVSKAIDVADSVTEEDVKLLHPKDKFAIAAKASGVLQKAQEIALKGRAQNLNENKFLKEIGSLAAGGSDSKLIEGDSSSVEHEVIGGGVK